MRRILLLLALLLAPPAAAQGTVALLENVPPLYLGSLDAGDFDGDGRLDLLVTGTDGTQVRTRVYRYVEERIVPVPMSAPLIYASYAEVQPSVDVPQTWSGEAAWGDYDGDGDPDVLVTGALRLTAPFAPVAMVYANRNGALVEVTGATRVLTPVHNSAVAWGDYDGDGDADIVLAGRTAEGARVTHLFRNDDGGHEGAFARVATDIVGVEAGDLAWGDYDGDGDLDLALVGISDGGATARVYRNDGATFTDVGAGLEGLLGGTVAWGDYDGDGDLDLLLAGGAFAPTIAQGVTLVYRNDGGTFTRLDLGLRGVLGTRALWGYSNDDSALDIAVVGPGTGTAEEDASMQIYLNDTTSGGDRFTAGRRFGGVALGEALWYDYNGDGQHDLLLMGLQDGRPVTMVYRNGEPPSDDGPEDPN